MFENPDFQVDEQSEEFRLLNPLVSKISEKRKKKLKLLQEQEAREQVNIFSTQLIINKWTGLLPVFLFYLTI